MVRYQVILAYDGTQFRGFQRQRGGSQDRTVQQVFEAALCKIGWQGKSILASGRTDTGVHASGQVVAFDLDWKHSPETLRDALNAILPADIAVPDVRIAPEGFHPRFDALSRRYRYRIFCQETRNPLRERYAWRVWPAVALDLLQQSAGYLAGTHDFAAFGTPPRTGGSTIRRVYQAHWLEEGSDLIFEVTADAFLYHMVRHLVSIQVAIGQGRLSPQVLLEHLSTGGSRRVQGLAPPRGLALVEVLYPSWVGE